MEFVVFKRDISVNRDSPNDGLHTLAAKTSVVDVKQHFFDSLSKLGTITCFKETESQEELERLLGRPDVVMAVVHGDSGSPLHRFLHAVPRRILWQSLGSLMVPSHVLRSIARIDTLMVLVTTDYQRQQLETYLGRCLRNVASVCPAIDEQAFFPPSESERASARHKYGIAADTTHLVYAGRWLVTKGICQLLRAFTIWPQRNLRISLVGNFTPSFPLQAVRGHHGTFEQFLEAFYPKSELPFDLELLPAQYGPDLRELFWSADAFVCPSWHEDENFGITPRQAALCGTPVVVTEFGGLMPLSRFLPCGGVHTYPSASGVRFSLRDLHAHTIAAVESRKDAGPSSISDIRQECDRHKSLKDLEAAVQRLLDVPLRVPPPDADLWKLGLRKVFEEARSDFLLPLLKHSTRIPDGLFAFGSGPPSPEFPSNELFRVVQGMYTSQFTPPVVDAGSRWRGFFRCTLWDELRAVVEWGYPGPRMRRYTAAEWSTLKTCVAQDAAGEIVFSPPRQDVAAMIQELVDFGYLVPDDDSRRAP